MNNNIPTLMCDFYKISHRVQYPKNTQLVYSNLTARSDKYNQCANSDFYDKKFTWFGLRYFLINLNEIFNNHFFNQPITECVKEYARIIKYCLNDNNPDTSHIEALHKLGYLPLEIKALPELARVDFGIPVLTIKNTSPDFFWLTNFIETWLSSDLWLLSNSASIAYEYKKICTEYAKNTCDNDDHVQFQCHDFSFRGMAGREAATMSGMGHLTAFKGTDTIPAIIAMEKYYNKNIETELVGCSIPASEHSVMCAGGGGKDDEYNTYKRFITELYPRGLVSIVSDTWDFWAVLNDILPKLKNEIMARDGKVVIRPDSGDPVDIICGNLNCKYQYTDEYSFDEFIKLAEDDIIDYVKDNTPHGNIGVDVQTLRFKYKEKYFDITIDNIQWNRHDKQYYFIDMWDEPNVTWVEVEILPEYKGAIEVLWDLFGGTINDKGYKVLDSHIGLIYGDSITIERCQEILKRLQNKGFASSNVVFGVGSYTYQYNTRDSMGWAVKATYCEIDDKPMSIYKQPKTDAGKNSAKGLLKVIKLNNNYVLLENQELELTANSITDELKLVYKDGVIIN